MKTFSDTEGQLRTLAKDSTSKITNPIFRSFSRLSISITVGISLWFLMALRANAQLYSWSIDEIYSSADGTVQFIELSSPRAPAGLLLSGYVITAQNAAVTVGRNFFSEVS